MKNRVCAVFCIAAALTLAACSTTSGRIRERQEAFDRYPERIQHNLRSGIIEVGYTAEMVYIALGDPDRKAEVVTGESISEVWTWWRSSPGIAIGLGGWNSLGSHVGLGTGVSFGERARREAEAVVVFRSGVVHLFEVLAAR
jgi:hypothetical protein